MAEVDGVCRAGVGVCTLEAANVSPLPGSGQDEADSSLHAECGLACLCRGVDFNCCALSECCHRIQHGNACTGRGKSDIVTS